MPPSMAAGSLDHLVGAGIYRCRNLKADRLCSFQVDNEFERDWLCEGQIFRLSAVQYLIGVERAHPKQVGEANAVGHKPTGDDIFTDLEQSRDSVLQEEVNNRWHMRQMQRIASRQYRVGAFGRHLGKNSVEIHCGPRLQGNNRHVE